MRIAIVSDIHGNRAALEAVLIDLKQTAPDVILHGGDLAHGGSSPAYIVDRVRGLGWQGVVGNADEVLFRPKSLTEFSSSLPQLQHLWTAIEEMAAASRDALGDERIAWLSTLPMHQIVDSVALVHASPSSCWRAPDQAASDAELESTYGGYGKPIAVYGHIHHPFIRDLAGLIVVNSGSVSMSYDGDPRASYLLIDNGVPSIRRVEYKIEAEIKALEESKIPHANWIVRMLKTGRPEMP